MQCSVMSNPWKPCGPESLEDGSLSTGYRGASQCRYNLSSHPVPKSCHGIIQSSRTLSLISAMAAGCSSSSRVVSLAQRKKAPRVSCVRLCGIVSSASEPLQSPMHSESLKPSWKARVFTFTPEMKLQPSRQVQHNLCNLQSFCGQRTCWKNCFICFMRLWPGHRPTMDPSTPTSEVLRRGTQTSTTAQSETERNTEMEAFYRTW